MKAKHLLSMVFALAVFTGCAKEQLFEQEAVQGDLIPISVNSSIRQEPTKATADGFVGGDAVGLFAVNYINDNAQAGTLVPEGNQADNVKYVFDETNHKWTPVKSVYYKDINTHADLYLYYPYQKSISDVNAAGFEVQKDQSSAATATSLSGYEASDFLWGKGEDVTPSQSAVNIRLSHKMAAVQVTLAEGTGFGEGEFESLEKSIILTNTTRKATINYATGEVAPLGAPQMDGIVMCPQSDGSWRAIAVPQSVAAGTQLFAITVNGMSYSFKQGEAAEYQSGRQTNFTITVNKKTPSGDIEFTLTSAQITDWTEDLNTHGGEARQYFVVNVAEPGTLRTAIESLGKNPSKIKNLKVVGAVSADDFYYMRDEMSILEAVNMKEANLTDNIIPDSAFSEKNSLTYFLFPDNVISIGNYAFYNTGLSGSLVVPNNVTKIGNYAFTRTNIGNLVLDMNIDSIGDWAFSGCSALSGELYLPYSLSRIGDDAFESCNFSGKLVLPEDLKYLGGGAFYQAGNFVGDVKMPDYITEVPGNCFAGCTFLGRLDLNNVSLIGSGAFEACSFQGELIIPDGIVNIPYRCFYGNKFSLVKFPASLKTIEEQAFLNNYWIISPIEFPEGFVTVGNRAFGGCSGIPSLTFPSTTQTIQQYAFQDCYGITSIISYAIEPPTVQIGGFYGVAKDNFSVEVPIQSIIRYQTEEGWGDFKRVTAHYDFSVSRQRIRALNAEQSRKYTLRAPSDMAWKIKSQPDWVTVVPSSGIGKTEITVNVSEMTSNVVGTFQVNEGTYFNPSYHDYQGRSGEIVFELEKQDYTCKMDVEQYDCDYSDGDVISYKSATTGPGIDIVFIGEGYDAKDIVDGKFLSDARNGYEYFFDIEPYKTYINYFNVIAVIAKSDESGISTVNTIVDTRFGSFITPNNKIDLDAESCFAVSVNAKSTIDLTKSLTVLLLNNSLYDPACCLMFGDGSAIACCTVSEENYPCDFRGIIQHEAGGHGFGKLGDEYIYHTEFISNCSCTCCEHPKNDNDISTEFGIYKSLGWFKNLSMFSDCTQVPWAHLLYNPKYSDKVDMYEGGYMHSRGIYRSEATSCMNNNIPYYSAISRQAIVERIKEYANEEFNFEDFVAKDSWAVGTKASLAFFDWTFGVDPLWNRGSEKGSIIYMGEHPDYSKIK